MVMVHCINCIPKCMNWQHNPYNGCRPNSANAVECLPKPRCLGRIGDASHHGMHNTPNRGLTPVSLTAVQRHVLIIHNPIMSRLSSNCTFSTRLSILSQWKAVVRTMCSQTQWNAEQRIWSSRCWVERRLSGSASEYGSWKYVEEVLREFASVL